MAKVIIGIHGLGNKPPRETLQKWWLAAMKEGIKRLGKSVEMPAFELVYWADILYERPLDEQITDEKDPYFLDEHYTPAPANYEPEDHSFRQKVLDFIEGQLDKLFLNDDLTVNYSGITDMIIHRYFKDLEAYYQEECLDEKDEKCHARHLIRKRLVDTLKKYEGDEIMLISHSMGTIIAYDVLTFLVPDINIHTFVTMGSPLGFPVVQGKIAHEWHEKKLVPVRLSTPPAVSKHWYNFADLTDKIALIYKLAENYQPNDSGIQARDFLVQNDYFNGQGYNPHKSFGYLRAPAFTKILCRFYAKKRIWHYMRDVLRFKPWRSDKQ